MPLENYVIVILALLFIVGYLIGRQRNYKIQKEIWRVLSSEIKPYSKSVSFRSLGSSGFKIACRLGKEAPLRKLEISTILLDREFLLYYLISKYRKQHDRIILKSNFKDTPNFRLEVIPRGVKANKGMPENFIRLKEVRLGGISENLLVKASKVTTARKIFSDDALLNSFLQLKGYVKRLSITTEEPHLLLVCSWEKNVVHPLLDFTWNCGEMVDALVKGR